MDHLNSDQLRAYAVDELDHDTCLDVEIHLATCQHCAERVKALLSVRGNFDQIWETWTVTTHAEEFQVARLRYALSRAPASPDLRERLAQWAAHITESVGTALSVFLDASTHAVSVAQEGLEFLHGMSFPRFEPVPVPFSIAGSGGGQPWAAFVAPTPQWTKVTFDPTQRRALVQSDVPTVPRPLVALVARDGSWAHVAPFRAVEGEAFVLTEFEEIPSGDFLLLIEKTPDNPA
ncbi:hypothetical protein JXA88_01740 [Candidatus Fermentibacteria bacterium]|nr:hypothetical protein [Candidatus Fermentibacteria bacterium]